MKRIDLTQCKSDLHFPVTRAIPTVIEENPFTRIWNFATYRRKFKIQEDYVLWVPSIAKWIFIPAFFIFDGASVPKILNNLYSPTGMLLLGAAPHDFGYRYKGLLYVDYLGNLEFKTHTKDELDEIFNNLCAYESGMPKASKVATYTLTAFGFLGWNENRKNECSLQEDFPEVFVPEEVDLYEKPPKDSATAK